jgi:hypothetical protein
MFSVRRTKVAVLGIALAASLGVALVIRTAASRAGPPPPPPPFRIERSGTLPVEGRVFTAVLVAHSLDPWRLTCSTYFRGPSIVPHGQEFVYARLGTDTRSCSFFVPRRTAGKALEVSVHATDASGNSSYFNPGWRIISHAAGLAAAVVTRTPASQAEPPPGRFHFQIVGSRTPPVAGRAFTAVLVTHLLETGGPWTLTCSASLRGRSIVPNVQEFGDTVSTTDTRSCSFYVPRGTAGKGLTFTVDATDPSGNSRHATGGWRIVSHG